MADDIVQPRRRPCYVHQLRSLANPATAERAAARTGDRHAHEQPCPILFGPYSRVHASFTRHCQVLDFEARSPELGGVGGYAAVHYRTLDRYANCMYQLDCLASHADRLDGILERAPLCQSVHKRELANSSVLATDGSLDADICSMSFEYVRAALVRGAATSLPLFLAHDHMNKTRACAIIKEHNATVYR